MQVIYTQPTSFVATVSTIFGTSENWNSAYSTTITSSGTWLADNGNAATSNIFLGTNTEYNLGIKTNNTNRLIFLSGGGSTLLTDITATSANLCQYFWSTLELICDSVPLLLTRDPLDINSKPAFSAPNSGPYKYFVNWDGSQWVFSTDDGVGLIFATLASEDITQGSWSVLLIYSTIVTGSLSYTTDKYFTKHSNDRLYLSRAGDSVYSAYTFDSLTLSNLTINNVGNPLNINYGENGIVFSYNNGGTPYWKLYNDGSNFNIVNTYNSPATFDTQFRPNGITTSYYDGVYNNSIVLDSLNGLISITNLDVPKGNSDQWSSAYTTLCSTSAFKISNTIAPSQFPTGYIFTNDDNGRTYHVDTRSASVSVLLPGSLTNDFSVTLITLGTNNMHVSSTQVPMLCATGTKVNLAFASTFLYKYDNLYWGLGSLI